MAKRRITKSVGLAQSVALIHLEEVLDEKILQSGLEVEVIDCGEPKRYIFFQGEIKTLTTGRTLKCLVTVHVCRTFDEKWEVSFVDSHINLNGKHGRDAEQKYTFKEFPTEERIYQV